MIRISEPYFIFLIKEEMLSWFGILISDKELANAQGHEKDSLAAFLANSLNAELVNIVL